MAFASSSSSSSPASLQIPQIKYDVFLSFRGDDTRNNFTSHLHAALCQKNIEAFIDDQLRRGDEISQSLLDVIEASNISVVIFSKDYASSWWCLDELVKILECKNKYGRIVIPIFYQVGPSNVRKQSGIFGDGFKKLIDQRERFQEKLQSWECALMDAGKISGYHVDGNRSESKLIEQIVDDILKKLNDTLTNPSDNKDHLIGLYSRIKEIESVLSTESKDICTLGIWGIGGIGKTTIADAIFKRNYSNFEGYCFISNVREEEEKDRRLHHLRQKLLSTLLTDQIVKYGIPNIGLTFESKRLSRKKVLIVLDDVTRVEQIECLIKDLSFAMGSRIIITTRDKHVLDICKVVSDICRVDFLYEMKKLEDDDAFKLFSRHAFGQNSPNVGYEELSNKVIEYADGVPLALKVLGRFLAGRNKEKWTSAIKKLEKILNKEILEVLRISYDDLDHVQKNIFLDIACFFEEKDKNLVIEFSEACDFFGEIGIDVLVDKSLISISSDNMIRMHNLLREMGRAIVLQEAGNDLGKCSRLWHHEDIYKVLTCNTATEVIEGISLDMSQVRELILDPCVFTKMKKLRFLRFYGENKFKVSMCTSIFSRFLSYFQDLTFVELRYFEWHGYPLSRLPSIIHPERLVSLEIPNGNIKQLWNGVQNLGNLKRLGLAGCKQLAKIPDLSLAQNLEHLDLKSCASLIEIHSSIQLLKKLKYLYVSFCSNLKRFPEIKSKNLKSLFLTETAIEEVPSSIGSLSRLNTLDLTNCVRLKSLPSSIYQLNDLQCLSLDNCSNLERLSNEGENLEGMKIVDGSETGIREAPSSIARFSEISSHHPLGFLSYEGLDLLRFLSLRNCGIKELPENIFGCWLSLIDLCLDCNGFERIPESIIHLSELQKLTLSNCKRLKSLPELPRGLCYLDTCNCTSLESIAGLSCLFESLESRFHFGDCLKLDRNDLNQIAEDVLQKLQLHFARYQWVIWYNKVGYICFPGSEIPEWVRYQSTGSSITFTLPPSCFNNNIFGIAFCVVFSFKHYDKSDLLDLWVGWTKCGRMVPLIDFSVGRRHVYLRSDHVLLASMSRNFLGYNDNNEVFFKFYDKYSSGAPIECDKAIKKCGIHLFYAADFGESAKHRREIYDLQGGEPHPKIEILNEPNEGERIII